jgi:signal peptide peptidase-like protein 2B
MFGRIEQKNFWWRIALLLQWIGGVVAVLPTAKIDVGMEGHGTISTLLASEASFGPSLAMDADNNEPMRPMLPPQDNPLLCNTDYDINNNNNVETSASSVAQVMLVPRGGCTFETKTIAAQKSGASAVVVYETLASRYSLNTTESSSATPTADDIIFPKDKEDYDCDKARVEIPLSSLNFDPLPYNAEVNDPLLTASHSEEFCPSERTLLTGRKSEDGTMMEACCAWDTFIWLYNDPSLASAEDQIKIPSVYMNMREASNIFNLLQDSSNDNNIFLTIYARHAPKYNLSAILIWALGVFVAALASYLSASEYRNAKLYISAKIQQREHQQQYHQQQSDPDGLTLSAMSADGARSRSKSPNKVDSRQQQMVFEPPLQDNDEQMLQTNVAFSSEQTAPREEEMELSMGHALGFVVFASAGLLTLFFLKIYSIVKVFYAFGCSSAIMQVIFIPFYHRLAKNIHIKDRILIHKIPCDLGHLSLLESLALVTSYGIGFIWLLIGFTQRHPETNLFYWIMQDIMGACMCITFLNTIKLNSIKVASVLLIVAFFYDIFFVFITPLLTRGSQSIMITVATSGGPPKASPNWCEKYPDDKDCQGGDPLPMLFTIPRINDYRDGSSLLGLGDIVLPGLLLSFASRFDEAKRLLGTVRGGNTRTINSYPENSSSGIISKLCCCCCNGGYFVPVVIAYGIGLLMANAAVYLMNYGQPALLYLVPCCLGTVIFLGWRRGELSELWNTPRVIRGADSLLHGEASPPSQSSDDPEEALITTDTPVKTNNNAAPTNSSSDNGGTLLNLT